MNKENRLSYFIGKGEKSTTNLSFFLRLIVVLLVSAIPSLCFSAQAVPSPQQIDLTAEERAWLKAHPEITLGFTSEIEPTVIVGEDGALSGVLVDVYDELEKMTGLKVKIEIDTWPAVIEKAKDGELDGILVSSSVLAKSIGLLHSQRLIKGTHVIFARSDAPFEIHNEKDLIGKRVAVLKGIHVTTQALATYKNQIEVIEADSALEMLKLVLTGRADVAYGLSYHNYLIAKQMLVGIEPIYVSDLLSADGVASIRADWPQLISIINKGLKAMGEARLHAIANRWIQIDMKKPLKSDVFILSELKTIKRIDLTDQEQAWIEEHPVVRGVMDLNWAPVEFKDKEGKYQGINKEYLKRLEELLGIRFELAEISSWSEGVAAVRDKRLDMVSTMVRTAEREKFALFTETYKSMGVNIFARNDGISYIGTLDRLVNKRVGVVEGYAVTKWMSRDYPGMQLIPVKSVQDGLRKIDSGEVDAFVGNVVTGRYYITQLNLSNVHIAGETPYRIDENMAVRDDWPLFVGILQKGLDAIEQSERDAFNNKWMSVLREVETDYTIVWQILFVASLIFGGTFYWNRKLSKQLEVEKEFSTIQKQFTTLVDNIPGTTYRCLLDENWTMLFVSKEIEKITGYPASDFIGKNSIRTFAEFMHKDDIQPIWENTNKAVDEKHAYINEYRMIDKYGITHYVYAKGRAIYSEDGTPEYLDGVIIDISDKKEAEVATAAANFALIESEQLLRQRDIEFHKLVDNIPGLFWRVENAPEWPVVYFSKGATELTGYTAEEFMEEKVKWVDRTHPDDLVRLINVISDAVDKKDVFDITYRIIKSDGEIRWVREIGVYFDRGQGNVPYLDGYVLDVHKEILAEEELKQANNKLKELDKLKSMFIASMSHELRTPLNSIIGFSGMMLRGISGDLNEEQQDNIRRVSRAGHHLLELVTDVIDISKIEAGRIDMHTQHFSLKEVIDEAVETIRPQADNKQLALEVEATSWPQMYSDRKRLLQCLLNYLSNAVKFTEQGTVTMIVRELDGDVEIAVRDTGIGIPDEDIPKLFEAFERLESHLRIKAGGSGLGLYLTKKIAKDVLHGSVALESEAGRGSTFFLRIPKEVVIEDEQAEESAE